MTSIPLYPVSLHAHVPEARRLRREQPAVWKSLFEHGWWEVLAACGPDLRLLTPETLPQVQAQLSSCGLPAAVGQWLGLLTEGYPGLLQEAGAAALPASFSSGRRRS